MDEPLRLSNLIPRQPRTYVFLGALSVACVAGLVALHVLSRLFLASLTTDSKVAALDLDTEGNLASWFSFAVFFLAGQMALVLRHLAGTTILAVPDKYYRRRVRSGLLFTAFMCFTMSLDEGASLHEGFKEMIARIIGTPLYGDGSIFWIVPYFFLLAVMGCKLLRLMGASPAGLMLLATGGLWALAIANQLELFFSNVQLGIIMEESCEMLGQACLLGSLCLLGRQWIEAGAKHQSHAQPSPLPAHTMELTASRG